MYDNVCKYLIETFPTDFATWLLGEPVALTQLQPKELVSEPIRADSLILQGDRVVLHVEFQTQPDPQMARRMADYYLRIHRQFPSKPVRQVVVYLRPSRSPLVRETVFRSGGMTHQFQVIRLWEQPLAPFLEVLGLLPLAILTEIGDRDARELLQAIQARIEQLAADRGTQGNIEMATAVLAGLKLEPEVIQQVMRSRTMRESSFYQLVLEEGRQEGEERGQRRVLRTIVPVLQSSGFPVERILGLFGLTVADLAADPDPDDETDASR